MRKEGWLDQNNPGDPGFLLPQSFMEVGTEQQLDFLREWQHTLWSAGYLGMHWPREYGGQGADPTGPPVRAESRALGHTSSLLAYTCD